MRNALLFLICVFTAALLVIPPVAAQPLLLASFTFTAADEVKIGQPTELVLTVEGAAGLRLIFPQFPVEWGDFSVIEVSEPYEAESLVGEPVDALALTVVPWQTGELLTPETVIYYVDDATEQQQSLFVQSTSLTVFSVLDNNPSLRPRKPVVNMPYVPGTLIVGIALFVVAVAGLAIYQSRESIAREYRKLRTGRVREPRLSLARRLMIELSSLSSREMDLASQWGAVGDIVREYLTQRCGVQAQAYTTDELLNLLYVRNALPAQRLKELYRILIRADLAKFAPNDVSEQDVTLAEIAGRWIQMVEKQTPDEEAVA